MGTIWVAYVDTLFLGWQYTSAPTVCCCSKVVYCTVIVLVIYILSQLVLERHRGL